MRADGNCQGEGEQQLVLLEEGAANVDGEGVGEVRYERLDAAGEVLRLLRAGNGVLEEVDEPQQ